LEASPDATIIVQYFRRMLVWHGESVWGEKERIQGQQWEGKCLSNLDKVVFNDTCHLQAR
jgi:hypothetical protein